jgi:hypothetical protein
MIGTKRDTNLISSSRLDMTTQHIDNTEALPGRFENSTGYYLILGGYAALNGRTLTLNEFEMQVSADPRTDDEVLAVHVESLSCQVSAAFAADAERYRSKKVIKLRNDQRPEAK